ncbi:LOW QUALITY PROTEIN: vomeronasal type-1 receptor 2-like [Neomonachus schauinslandi]|uniref:Vomeronasal type-1 receptor n=1 Tax=Neomonachus schauinslandi TaxID=29088 RepID=A0A8M1M085_NEOSC|nr:LOW QUALITY PROTEIN: vomeronasal type-1 receptor 2-like [Neomonachus schauinslandi]
MALMDAEFAVIFLFQIVVGALGNFLLFCRYTSFLDLRGYRSKSTDLILRHLTLTNSLVILSRGIPETMAAFELRYFLNDFGCKVVFFVHRVSRGVSIGTTCLLSVFQAITISPWNSRWAALKGKAPKYIGPSNILCWIMNIMLNIMVPVYMTDKRNNTNTSKTMDFRYCTSALHDKDTDLLYMVLVSSHDVLCLGLITWASGSMVSTLYKHKQRVQHIYRTKVSPRSSSEIRATRSILLLVTPFVSFHTLSSIITMYFSIFRKTSWWLINTSALINACFPTACPFVLLSQDHCVSRLFSVCTGRNTQFPHLIRKIETVWFALRSAA